MKGFNPSPENRRITREVLNGGDRNPKTLNKSLRTASRKEFYVVGMEQSYDGFEAIFVVNRNERGSDFFHHCCNRN